MSNGRESSKQIVHLLKVIKLGKKYGLKSVEVSDNFISIEFNDNSSAENKKKPTKKELLSLEKVREDLLLEEMQLLDPAAYEEELIKMSGGLKEI